MVELGQMEQLRLVSEVGNGSVTIVNAGLIQCGFAGGGGGGGVYSDPNKNSRDPVISGGGGGGGAGFPNGLGGSGAGTGSVCCK